MLRAVSTIDADKALQSIPSRGRGRNVENEARPRQKNVEAEARPRQEKIRLEAASSRGICLDDYISD